MLHSGEEHSVKEHFVSPPESGHCESTSYLVGTKGNGWSGGTWNILPSEM